jgi:hypothetical protein
MACRVWVAKAGWVAPVAPVDTEAPAHMGPTPPPPLPHKTAAEAALVAWVALAVPEALVVWVRLTVQPAAVARAAQPGTVA